MGQQYKALLSTGHSSNGFDLFLLQYFGQQNVDFQRHFSITGKIGAQ
jgi:hypothetical protein